MDEIIEKLNIINKLVNSVENFFELLNVIKYDKVINNANDILEILNIKNFINVRDFLSAFIINKYPFDVIGDIKLKENINIIILVKTLLKYNNVTLNKFKSNLTQFVFHFNKWKSEDLEILKQQLFNEYHQLTIDILDTDNEDKKEIFKKCKEELLNYAKAIGGDDFIEEVKSYIPIVANKKELFKEFDNVIWSDIISQCENDDYSSIIEIIRFIENILITIKPNDSDNIKNIFNIDDIIYKLINNSYDEEYVFNWGTNIFDIIKVIQSEEHDKLLEEFKDELNNSKDLLKTIKNIFTLIKQLVNDLESLHI